MRRKEDLTNYEGAEGLVSVVDFRESNLVSGCLMEKRWTIHRFAMLSVLGNKCIPSLFYSEYPSLNPRHLFVID